MSLAVISFQASLIFLTMLAFLNGPPLKTFCLHILKENYLIEFLAPKSWSWSRYHGLNPHPILAPHLHVSVPSLLHLLSQFLTCSTSIFTHRHYISLSL